MAAVIGDSHRPLPEDIVIDILSRLPVKSLLRFQSVCRQWHAFITSPVFAVKHFHQSINNAHLLVHWYGSVIQDDLSLPPLHGVYAFNLFINGNLENFDMLDYVGTGQVRQLRGPCNGIFCMRSTTRSFYLWNPATRRSILLPSPPRSFHDISEMGFGVDPFTDEVKIVLIYWDMFASGNLCPYFDLYTSSNDSWRRFENDSFLNHVSHVFTTRCSSTFVDGCYYWKKCDKVTRGYDILAFDMHSEVFHEIVMPEPVRSKVEGELVVCDDTLMLFSYDRDVYDKLIEMWSIEKEGSWTKLYSVVLPFHFLRPLGFYKSDKIFLFTRHQGVPVLMTYDLISHCTRIISVVKDGEAKIYDIWPIHYKDSLRSL